MPVIDTASLAGMRLGASQNLQTYCGLDCCITLEVWEELTRQFNQPPAIYDFERALQGPYLEIMLRGFRVDELTRRQVAGQLSQRIANLQLILNRMAYAVWDRGLNPRSHQQLVDFFFGAMRLPEIWQSQKGVRKLSVNREALEKLETYLYARPFISCILAIRDLAKQLEVFTTSIDADNRYRTSYNIAGTETGRPSSSENAFGTGGNAQNIAPSLRYVFVADLGWKICVIDLEQVEARDVGFLIGCLFGDWEFLNACESGDLHTANTRRIWPELGWTGDIREDRKLAERDFYRDFTYRDMAKRGSHLSNYMGTAWTASRHLKVPLHIMEEFQARYCRGRSADSKKGLPAIVPAFPGIPRYWNWIATELQTTGLLETPFGRRRHFFGRHGDETTQREAIAFLPQSMTADRTNLGLFNVWRNQGGRANGPDEVQVLAQTHDSITFQFREDGDEEAIIRAALANMSIPLDSPSGRRYVVPGEAKVGWNWGNRVTPEDIARASAAGRRPPRLNPDGLVKWAPGADRRRRQTGLQRSII